MSCPERKVKCGPLSRGCLTDSSSPRASASETKPWPGGFSASFSGWRSSVGGCHTPKDEGRSVAWGQAPCHGQPPLKVSPSRWPQTASNYLMQFLTNLCLHRNRCRLPSKHDGDNQDWGLGGARWAWCWAVWTGEPSIRKSKDRCKSYLKWFEFCFTLNMVKLRFPDVALKSRVKWQQLWFKCTFNRESHIQLWLQILLTRFLGLPGPGGAEGPQAPPTRFLESVSHSPSWPGHSFLKVHWHLWLHTV